MRNIEYKASFDRLYRKLDANDQETVDEVLEEFLSALEAKELPKGLGLKRLSGDIWEIRANLSLRVGFQMKKDSIHFGVVGTHETIKKFLKNSL